MARRVRVASLETRTARAKLPVRGKPHYRVLGEGVHIGYRKGKTGGRWVARVYAGNQAYEVTTIADADDMLDANGVTVLDFWQAQDRARGMHLAKVAPKPESLPDITVATAIEEYLAARQLADRRDDGYRLKQHVLASSLKDKSLTDLDRSDLADWRSGLSPKGLKPATVVRITTDLKAALNAAIKKHSKRLSANLSLEVRNGLASTGEGGGSTARPLQVLSDADVSAVLSSAGEVDREGDWGGDLHAFLVVAAATGARFSQIARITVGDVQVAQSRIMVPVSQKGKGQKPISHTARPVGADVIALLKPRIAGRMGHEALLLRPRWRQTDKMTWEKYSREPWLNASELSRPWQAVRQKAHLPAGVVPYAFRHSSIVRGLRSGQPVRLVAALHDTSSAMIEKHYAAYIVDAMDDLARLSVVPLLGATVSPLKQVGA